MMLSAYLVIFGASARDLPVTMLAQEPTQSKWSVGGELQLKWQDQNYLPVGLQFEAGDPLIETAKKAGVKDFNIEIAVTKNWSEALASLEGKNTFLTVNSALPSAKGITVQPQYYRVTNIKKSGTLRCNLPGSTSALVCIALTRDGSLISSKVHPVNQGKLVAEYRAATDADQIALIYPIGESMEMEDLWSKLDLRRDQVLRQIKSIRNASNLRGIINPLGTTPFLANQDSGFVPTDPVFQTEFEDFLEEKYRNISSLARAWGLRLQSDTLGNLNNSQNFKNIAAIVPLWNGQRGITYFFNIDQGNLIATDERKSQYWVDLAESISRTRMKRVHRILRSLRKEIGVPVFQEWNGWSWFFENPHSELTGLTTRVSQWSSDAVSKSVAGALSSTLRTSAPGPIIATDLPWTAEMATNAELPIDLTNFGIRGAFFRTKNPAAFEKIAAIQLSSNLERPRGVFYPQNASNPALTLRLSDGSWWLPTPNDGNRIPLGRDVFAYQMMLGPTPSYVIWKNGPASDVEFRLTNPLKARFRSSSLNPLNVIATKTGIRLNLDSSPVIVEDADHCPVPESELIRLEREVGKMTEYAASQRKDVGLELLEFRGFKELITSSPFKALTNAQKVHSKMGLKFSGVIWTELEASTDHQFSEVIKDAGCSGGSALSVRTTLPELQPLLYANIFVPQRTTLPVEIWLAAKIPNAEDRERIKVKIGGQSLPIRGTGVNPYGSGFAWYRLGTSRLPSIRTEIRIEVNGVATTNLAFDAIVVSPNAFVPDNTKIPEFLIPDVKKPDNPKNSLDLLD